MNGASARAGTRFSPSQAHTKCGPVISDTFRSVPSGDSMMVSAEMHFPTRFAAMKQRVAVAAPILKNARCCGYNSRRSGPASGK